MFSKLIFLGLLACVPSIYSASAPFITKCKRDDSKCMKASAQRAIPIFAKGIPELGVETMDPLKMKILDASSKDLKLLLKDISGTGLKDCLAKKIQFDGAEKLKVKLQCSVDFVGHYEMKGKLLVLPIEGNGPAHVILREVAISVDIQLAEVPGKDGQKHWSIKDHTHTYKLKEKATIELENLFNGNELLGRAAKDLIANNSNDVVVEVGPPIIDAVIDKAVKNVDNVFSSIPISELVE